MNDQVSIAGWPAKIVSAWALIGITSWSEAAAFLAFCYSFLLICEWLYKKLLRPALAVRGYIEIKKNRRADDDASQ